MVSLGWGSRFRHLLRGALKAGAATTGAEPTRVATHLEQYLDDHDHFLALWRRALNQPSLDTLTPALVESWAAERGLQVERVEERDIGGV